MVEVCGQEVFVIVCMVQQEYVCVVDQIVIVVDVEIEIVVYVVVCKDFNWVVEFFGYVVCGFQGFLVDFEEFVMLWVYDCSFFGVEVKEFCIKFFVVFQDSSGGYVVFVVYLCGGFVCFGEVGFVQLCDVFNVVMQVCLIVVQCVRVW